MRVRHDAERRRTVLVAGAVAGLAAAAVLAVALRRRGTPASSRPVGAAPAQHSAGADRVLRYPVPVGQDPARVLAVLHVAGLAAALDEGGTSHEVVVHADHGALDRERVRGVIADAGLDMSGHGTLDAPVLFADEEASAP